MKMKKIGALVLALVMVLAMSVTAFADDMGTSSPTGVIGDFESPDTTVAGITESISLKKEITAYNADAKDVYAPVMSYTYTITGATAAQLGDSTYTITDSNDTSIHASGTAVTVKVKPGAGTPTISNSGVVSWSNTDILDTAAAGAPNYRDITIDFSTVNFGATGVYRYIIEEKPNNLALTATTDIATYYAEGGVTQTDGTHVRYLDVYVKPSATYTGTAGADDWDVYGYVCTYANNATITATSKTASNAVKTNGFTAGTDQSGTAVTADSYYTYNLTLSKSVVNDAYAKATHSFPFSVIFSGSSITRNIKLDDEAGSGASDFATFTTAGAPTWTGVLKLKHNDSNTSNTELDGTTAVSTPNNSITFVGIPAGVDVEVYETNDVTGVTYQVDTTRTNATTATGVDNGVTDSSTPTGAQSTQANPKPAYQSTKTVFDTTANTNVDTSKAAAITNTLLTISPTGVTLRVAPYALMLAAGIVLLVIFMKRRKPATEDEE